MFERLRRVIRSFIGFFISTMEEPKLILEQAIRDMQDKVPLMNQGLAKARGGIIMLENEAKTYEREIAQLSAKIKAAIATKQEALGAQLAIRLKKTQDALARNREQMEAARAGYESLLKMKEKFMREMHAKTEEAMRAIQEAEASKWKSELADVFEQFEVAGVDQTVDEMVGKLRQKSAEAEGRLAMAAESVDTKSMEIDAKAEEIAGKELLKQFAAEMGLQTEGPSGGGEAEKTIGRKEEQKDQS